MKSFKDLCEEVNKLDEIGGVFPKLAQAGKWAWKRAGEILNAPSDERREKDRVSALDRDRKAVSELYEQRRKKIVYGITQLQTLIDKITEKLQEYGYLGFSDLKSDQPNQPRVDDMKAFCKELIKLRNGRIEQVHQLLEKSLPSQFLRNGLYDNKVLNRYTAALRGNQVESGEEFNKGQPLPVNDPAQVVARNKPNANPNLPKFQPKRNQ